MAALEHLNESLITGRNSIYNSGFKGIYGCPTCDNNTSGIIENMDGKVSQL